MGRLQVAIDRGGTFTDVVARTSDDKIVTMKLLSEDPEKYKDAPTEAIRRLLKQESFPLNPADVDWIRMGTTVATNALLERKGERVALLVTNGFRDLLYIGNQSRPKLFDLSVRIPDVLYEEVVEVQERVVLCRDDCKLDNEIRGKNEQKKTTTGDKIEVWKEVDEEQLRKDLNVIKEKGILSVAVALLHSYCFPDHELRVGEIARDMGFTNVSLSHQIIAMQKYVPRAHTACTDAYLTPCLKRYIDTFSSAFEKNKLDELNVLFMQSDGGLTPVEKFSGSRAILSGPAGGVVGYSTTSYIDSQPVIGFDMGGTSTDVSRFDGSLEHVLESTIASVTIQAPQLDINTVAAGGGSILTFRSGLFRVGPESAGAQPGPACYRKGGPLTVTDANLILGRLIAEDFPALFGPKGDEQLDSEVTSNKFKELTETINSFLKENEKKTLSVEEIALGFINVANESMSRPIRALTEGKGFDLRDHVLACFGGAGGQHACAIARTLGMKTVFVSRFAGVLSALGLALADVVHEMQEPSGKAINSDNWSTVIDRLKHLSKCGVEELTKQGHDQKSIIVEKYLNLRYEGTDCALMCTSNEDTPESFTNLFLKKYQDQFGFTLPDRPIITDDIRIRALAKSAMNIDRKIENRPNDKPLKESKKTKCYFEKGFVETSVYLIHELYANDKISGPAIIIDPSCTILIEPNCEATVTDCGDIHISIEHIKDDTDSTELDLIKLSIFQNRFMSIAEQCGRVLQLTAISTNIKERLDFSCAVFGPDGGLVANAPHIPVHLGAMQEAVQYQMRSIGHELRDGDVILSNHPAAGGTHLPDFTVITPVFHKENKDKPVFFVASRGHHADIGGLTPGSMPPNSTSLLQEGAQFISFKIVEQGKFKEKEVTDRLNEPGKLENCSGTRTLTHNIADLKAQIAANLKGVKLVQELIDIYSLKVVQAYMGYIQDNAETAVKDLLKSVVESLSEKENNEKDKDHAKLHAVDYMDDGTKICLCVEINGKERKAKFDFTGTSEQVWYNWNAPRSISYSAIIYCLRAMIPHEIPLNQGCMRPIEVILPPGSILDPHKDAAVVGGNVLTSQRLVDVILRAFNVCAASQGCMNNITWGDNNAMSYYETVAGGAGAGPKWHGRSGVHTHMTNTRITDPEILEKRFPVVLLKFSLRLQSGGHGKFRGGDGVDRQILFRTPITLSILTERRVHQPYGLCGGGNGQSGKNLLKRVDGRLVNLGGKCSVPMKPGDIFILLTPGGGGYGKEDDDHEHKSDEAEFRSFIERGSLFDYRLAQEGV
ncbi:unnamed protein product [Adineta steineri]|uniref:5-oxoprolinase n=1 Tax=Adineta steineri TaxID=433720 RepID=A0A815Z950_9BILA|nr:unnamed protein product [Adineta steineri]CAF1579760.1 unnamed protein product [Adineta steineri]